MGRTCSKHTRLAIVYVFAVLSGCEYFGSTDIPTEVRDLSRIQASTIIGKFKEGGLFCTRLAQKKVKDQAVRQLKS